MKLKGMFSKRIKEKDKKKKLATLKRMEATREKDSQNLRDLIKGKLVWAMNEKQKGLKVIRETQVQVHRLDGIIIFIQDILNPKKEKPKNDNSKT